MNLQQQPILDWTSKLLEKMTKLPNPPERHVETPHPYTQFHNTYRDKISLPNTIHRKLYNHIHRHPEPPNTHDLQNIFPYLPQQLLT